MLQLPRTPVCSALSSRIYPLKLQGLNSSAPTLHSADGLECETIVLFFVFSNSAAFAHVCQTGSRRHGVCDIACRRRTVDGLQFGGPSKCGSVFEQRGSQGHRCRRGAYKNWGEVALGSFALTSPSVALRSPSYSQRPPSPTSCLVKWSSTRTLVTPLS